MTSIIDHILAKRLFPMEKTSQMMITPEPPLYQIDQCPLKVMHNSLNIQVCRTYSTSQLFIRTYKINLYVVTLHCQWNLTNTGRYVHPQQVISFFWFFSHGTIKHRNMKVCCLINYRENYYLIKPSRCSLECCVNMEKQFFVFKKFDEGMQSKSHYSLWSFIITPIYWEHQETFQFRHITIFLFHSKKFVFTILSSPNSVY